MRLRGIERFSPDIRERVAKVVEGYQNFFRAIEVHRSALQEQMCQFPRQRVTDYGPIIRRWFGSFHGQQ